MHTSLFGAAVAPVIALLAGASPRIEARLERGLHLHAGGPDRAIWASSLLVGSRYVAAPLGDGSGPEDAPRFRLDAFDCLTLAETAIALGNAETLDGARRLLDDVRYDGPPDYAHRNHYIEAQWIPANLRKGWIADINREVAGPVVVETEKRYTRATWRMAERARRTLPALAPERRPNGRFTISLIPINRAAELAPRIPPGTLLFVVREDRPWRPYRVTHLGIVVAGARGERLLRHASDVMSTMRVRDEPLERFLARNARYDWWRVTGVSLFAIRDNRERARKLMAEPISATPTATRPRP